MSKRTHHSNSHRSHGVVAGAVSALSLLAVSTQAVNAEQLTVKTGDTIWGLAKQHGLSVSALEQANPSVKKLSDSVDLITVGQQLTLPSVHDASTDLNADGSYTVKPGDTLSSIASRYNITVNQLMAWNNLGANDSLYIGQQLSVTGPVASATAVQQPQQQAAPVSASQVQATNASPVSQQAVTSSTQVASSSAVVQQPVAASAYQNAASSAAVTSDASSVAVPNVQSAVSTAGSTAVNNKIEAASAVQTDNTQPTSVSANNSVAPQAQPTSTAVNNAVLYGQSFVQAAPVASQTPVAQTATASQATVAPQSNAAPVSQQPAAASEAQPQQSQVTNQQVQQAAPNAGQDLQHGSVVSLATKIANSNSVPYVWGGENLSGMDCSGLVKYVYANAEGKQLPHYTGALENCVDQHPVSEAKPGDLLFWGNHGSTYHTAIYTGNNQYVAAAKPGTNVATYTISPYFNPSFAGTVK